MYSQMLVIKVIIGLIVIKAHIANSCSCVEKSHSFKNGLNPFESWSTDKILTASITSNFSTLISNWCSNQCTQFKMKKINKNPIVVQLLPVTAIALMFLEK